MSALCARLTRLGSDPEPLAQEGRQGSTDHLPRAANMVKLQLMIDCANAA